MQVGLPGLACLNSHLSRERGASGQVRGQITRTSWNSLCFTAISATANRGGEGIGREDDDFDASGAQKLLICEPSSNIGHMSFAFTFAQISS